MEFRLTYQGPLRSTQKDAEGNQKDPRSDHKHAIRKTFHNQLKRLWDITPFLGLAARGGREVFVCDAVSLAAKHALYGFNFVPLVTEELNLICGLDILFLRPDKPGGIWKGDIDGRIKTLLDALSIPTANENYFKRTPAPDEKPFFCLLEDDKFITKISVESDQLLEFVSPEMDLGDTRLIITVRLRPYNIDWNTLQFT